jgi:hypothetical protein
MAQVGPAIAQLGLAIVLGYIFIFITDTLVGFLSVVIYSTPNPRRCFSPRSCRRLSAASSLGSCSIPLRPGADSGAAGAIRPPISAIGFQGPSLTLIHVMRNNRCPYCRRSVSRPGGVCRGCAQMLQRKSPRRSRRTRRRRFCRRCAPMQQRKSPRRSRRTGRRRCSRRSRRR